jgi:hypothetical protein
MWEQDMSVQFFVAVRPNGEEGISVSCDTCSTTLHFAGAPFLFEHCGGRRDEYKPAQTLWERMTKPALKRKPSAQLVEPRLTWLRDGWDGITRGEE